MHVVSINVGEARRVGNAISGIFKSSVDGPVLISKLGISSDVIGDAKYHGGPDQALYLYGGADYEWWNDELEHALEPGTFGDNLVISDLSCTSVNVGDRFEIADVILEATAPRIPCATLGRRMGDAQFPVRFRRAERPGFYCRVLREGKIEALDPVVRRAPANDDDANVSIVEMFHVYYDPSPPLKQLDRLLAAPIAERDRERFETKRRKVHG